MSSGSNRWFDKSIQLICTNNGKAGLVGEHSMMDGMPMIRYADHITKRKYAELKAASTQNPYSPSSSLPQSNDPVQNIFQGSISAMDFTDSKVESMINQGISDLPHSFTYPLKCNAI